MVLSGAEWEVVPSLPTLRVNLHRDDRPAILARRIWYGYGFFEHGDKSRPANDYAAWARHNRMAQSFTINCGHSWQTIIAENQALFDAHPEYRALVKGKRQGEQLCVSNTSVRDWWCAGHWSSSRRNRQQTWCLSSLPTVMANASAKAV